MSLEMKRLEDCKAGAPSSLSYWMEDSPAYHLPAQLRAVLRRAEVAERRLPADFLSVHRMAECRHQEAVHPDHLVRRVRRRVRLGLAHKPSIAEQ
jgi:hypothetical protein